MSDSPPTKRPAKKAAARPRREVHKAHDPLTDALEPEPVIEDGVYVIEAIVKRYRYMFRGGRILDVDSPYRADSTDRELALKEAQRRWGGKKDDWKIEGVTTLEPEA